MSANTHPQTHSSPVRRRAANVGNELVGGTYACQPGTTHRQGRDSFAEPPSSGMKAVVRTTPGWIDYYASVLLGAMNPCPCGYFGDPRRACSCAPGAIGRYQKR